MTINPRGDPSDKVSNPCYSALSQPSAVTPERFLLAGFAVCGGGSVVAADDWGGWNGITFHQVQGIADGFEWCFAVLSRSAGGFCCGRAQAWVGRTSMGLNPMVFQNTNLSLSINYVLQLVHYEVDGGSSHPNPQPPELAIRPKALKTAQHHINLRKAV